MADLVTKTCDMCGAIKKETNHWFKAYETKPGLLVIPSDAIPPVSTTEGEMRRFDLCSQSCVMKKLQEALSDE